MAGCRKSSLAHNTAVSIPVHGPLIDLRTPDWDPLLLGLCTFDFPKTARFLSKAYVSLRTPIMRQRMSISLISPLLVIFFLSSFLPPPPPWDWNLNSGLHICKEGAVYHPNHTSSHFGDSFNMNLEGDTDILTIDLEDRNCILFFSK
jgi:hypothetical protein